MTICLVVSLPINAPTDQLLAELGDSIQASVWTWNFNDYQYFQNQQAQVHFGAELPVGEFDQAVIFVPKSKELLNYLIHTIAAQLPQGSSVFLVGEKKAGIERAAKQLQPYGKTLKLDSARHCQLWQLILDCKVQTKALADWAQNYTVATPKGDLQICALPGVFTPKTLGCWHGCITALFESGYCWENCRFWLWCGCDAVLT